MSLKLYNTLTRQKEEFLPIDPSRVRLYVCGPTVYDFAHIGNARPVIVFDVLFRLLRHLYGDDHVVYVRNITDVDDKINERAARDYPALPLNEAIRQVTEATARQYHEDVAALGCLPPTHEPRATEHIDGMRAIIEQLVAAGFAYVAEDHVLFSPAAMDQADGDIPRYGALANRSLDEMIAGARVDVAPYKRAPTDFVLWKPSKPGEPAWPSPCAIATPGRPGWHIECSAMSKHFLGETFDIHGGGIDLVFPHHENEIAQSCCAHGTARMANVFMHNGFLQVEGQKMSKSLGNFVTIHELLHTTKFGGRKWPGAVLRLAMLKTHYRQPIDWTVKALEEAEGTLDRWRRRLNADPAYDGSIAESDDVFLNALSDDLNISSALTRIHSIMNRGHLAETSYPDNEQVGSFAFDDPDSGFLDKSTVIKNKAIAVACLDLLGIHLAANEAALDSDFISQIEPLIAARLAARAAKNWAESDRIRDQLAAMGIQLKDGKDKDGKPITTWEMKR